jgi:hypothetical protein
MESVGDTTSFFLTGLYGAGECPHSIGWKE